MLNLIIKDISHSQEIAALSSVFACLVTFGQLFPIIKHLPISITA